MVYPISYHLKRRLGVVSLKAHPRCSDESLTTSSFTILLFHPYKHAILIRFGDNTCKF